MKTGKYSLTYWNQSEADRHFGKHSANIPGSKTKEKSYKKSKWLLFILLLCLGQIGESGEWQVDKKSENLVKYTSKVPYVLTFHGITNQIDGYIYWEGDKIFGDKNELYFEVELNSLDSGIGKRDRDMRKVLETDKWPETSFKGNFVSVEKIDSSITAYRVMARGNIMIHGVEKAIDTPATISLEAGKMHVVSHFSVKLENFNIEAPALAAFIKVNQEIKLKLDFYLKESN